MALVAAWMLVLQGLLGAFASAATPPGANLDVFGNPLCITSTDAHGLGDDAYKGMPPCCLGVCVPLTALSDDTRAPHELENPLVLSLDATPAEKFETARFEPRHAATRQRAPPSAV